MKHVWLGHVAVTGVIQSQCNPNDCFDLNWILIDLKLSATR